MDPNYSLPQRFSIEPIATMRSLPAKATQERCCIPAWPGGAQGRWEWAREDVLGLVGKGPLQKV